MMRTNLMAYEGDVFLVTVTAPDAKALPWDEAHCRHRGPHRHSGADGCRVVLHRAQMWNREARRHWSRMHRTAQQKVKRDLGRGPRILGYVWQEQRRGVFHLHLVLGYAWRDREAADAYVALIRRRVGRHSFGFIDARNRDGKTGRSTVMASLAAATYLVNYATESSQLRALIENPARPTRPVYVSRELSRQTMCTMRRLRRVRYLHQIREHGIDQMFRNAGRHPAWFRDAREMLAVAALADAPRGP
jgi:hypothetical protein